jgi:hypothetical protein
MSEVTRREVRFEMLRPAQLREELARCPLVFLPVVPLEYQGPHFALGMDPLNAGMCAQEGCSRLGKDAVMPTTCMGTEREHPSNELVSQVLRGSIVQHTFPRAETWRGEDRLKRDLLDKHVMRGTLAAGPRRFFPANELRGGPQSERTTPLGLQ